MLRALWVLLSFASVALADVGDLVRRAQTRIDHQNNEGAIALLGRALAAEPSNGPALEMLIRLQPRDAGLRLRYLETGQPLDASTARQVLHDLRSLVADLPEGLCTRIERGTMIAVGSEEETCGPWLPWQHPDLVEPMPEPCGPLRQDALGSWAHAHAEALLRVEARLEREPLDDAVCWARLAFLLRVCGDPEGARRCLARARPESLHDRVLVAETTLEVVEDPYAWWQAHGKPLLEEVRADGRCGNHSWWTWLDMGVRKLLTEHRDIVGLAHLAVAEIETSSLALQPARSDSYTAILANWRANQAFSAIEPLEGAGMDVLRSRLLMEMGQGNMALAVLDDLAARHPDYLPGRRERYNAYQAAHLVSTSLECAEALCAAVISGRVGDTWPGLSSYSELLLRMGLENELRDLAARVLDTEGLVWQAMSLIEALPRERTTTLRERLLVRLAEAENPSEAWLEEGVLFALDEGRPDVAGQLVSRMQTSRVWYEDPWRSATARIGSVREGVARLRGFASLSPLPDVADRLLRRTCGHVDEVREPDELLLRVRCELGADGAFRALPGSAYVLSLLYDQRLQSDRVRRLRREAYDSGCRARGLLLDMAADGEDVLDELATCDPVAARLEAALRSEGTDALDAFLDEDQAWPSQLQTARVALRTRTRRWEATTDEAVELPSERWRRLAGDLCRTPAGVQETVRRLDTPEADFRTLDLRAFAERAPETVEAVVEGFRRGELSDRWKAGVRALIRREGGPVLDRLLDDLGVDLARHLLPAIRHDDEVWLQAVRRQRTRNPMDMRWVRVEAQLAEDPSLLEQAVVAEDRLPRGLLMDRCAEDDAALRRYVEMRAADPPLSVAQALQWTLTARKGEPIETEVLRALWSRCRSDLERSGLARIARVVGCTDLADAWDVELRRSTDVDARFQAIVRGRERKPGPADLPPMRDLASETCWTDEQACTLWIWAAEEAVRDKHSGRLVAALRGVWKHGLQGARREGERGDPITSATSLANNQVCSLLLPRLLEGEDAQALWYFAWRAANFGAMRPEERERLLDGCAERGYVDATQWSQSTAAGGRGAPLVECRRFLGTLRPGRETRLGGLPVLYLARSLSNQDRVLEAEDCLAAWAERCGPHFADEFQGGRYWGGVRIVRLFSVEERFGEVWQPPRAFVAEWLWSMGRIDEALRWVDDALAEPWPEEVLAECRYMKACIEIGAVYPDDDDTGGPGGSWVDEANPDLAPLAVRSLSFLLRDSPDADVRAKAHEFLERLYDEFPASRGAFVALLLEGIDDEGVPAEEVRIWEARLGHPGIAVRCEAESDLRAAARGVLPLLARLCRSSDPEVAARTRSILEDLSEP